MVCCWVHGIALAHNGYVLQFSRLGEIASTKAQLLRSTNPEIKRMSGNWTVGLWAKFEDITPSRFQPTFQILIQDDGNWFQPFAGMHEGYQFGAPGPVILKGVGDGAEGIISWHHYVESWDAASGIRKIYVDGELKVHRYHLLP